MSRNLDLLCRGFHKLNCLLKHNEPVRSGTSRGFPARFHRSIRSWILIKQCLLSNLESWKLVKQCLLSNLESWKCRGTARAFVFSKTDQTCKRICIV